MNVWRRSLISAREEGRVREGARELTGRGDQTEKRAPRSVAWCVQVRVLSGEPAACDSDRVGGRAQAQVVGGHG